MTLSIVLELTVEEANKKQFLRLVQAIFVAEFVVSDDLLRHCHLAYIEVLLVVEVYIWRNQLNVLTPQLHRVPNELDFAPENVVRY